MKAFIYKVNQYLLERYPTIWNTRLVWMLLTAFSLHLLFFLFGILTLSNPKLLQERYIGNIYFENGAVYLSIIISVLLLVGWLIFMFKNNAFKNFYPTSRFKLFGQFFSYLLIIFSCITFYLSYNYGIKSYIASKYPNAQIAKEIEIANDAAMFFSDDVSKYTIDQRRFPKPFSKLFCETKYNFIKQALPHLTFLDEKYQYYTLKTEALPINEHYPEIYADSDTTDTGFVYSKVKDSTRIYYFKDSVFDIRPYIKTDRPSYYNFSKTFYISVHDTLADNHDSYRSDNNIYYDEYGYSPNFTIRHQLRNQRNFELLERNNKTEIKTLLGDIIAISSTYKIDHNLTVEKWLELIYNPNAFEVKYFIRTEPKNEYDNVTSLPLDYTQLDKFYVDHVTDYYFNKDALHNVFENIEDIKASNPFAESIHFFMWFTLLLACIIFMFRITGLKSLLFSIITIGVLGLIIALITALVAYITKGNGDDIGYFISYFTLIISTLIIVIPLFMIHRVKKLVSAICVNISIIGFSLYVFLIVAIISMHQNDNCRESLEYFTNGYQCDTLLDTIGLNWSYILFFTGVVFIVFYASIIKKWKALPEG